MRSSIICRTPQILRVCEAASASTRRSFSSVSTKGRRSSQIRSCQICATRLSAHTQSLPLQRRYQSQTSAAASTQREPPITSSNPPKTHYDLFPQTLPQGPPPTGPFKIDIRALRKEFLQLQAVAHPDRHPQELKNRAEATSALINDAYKTLQNPLLRAQYLLRLRGIDVAGDETAKLGGEDQELLMEVLEARELIEEAQSEEELEELKKVNEGRIAESEAMLEEAFREDTSGEDGETGLEKARNEAVRLRYWGNIRESIDAWEKGKPVVLVH